MSKKKANTEVATIQVEDVPEETLPFSGEVIRAEATDEELAAATETAEALLQDEDVQGLLGRTYAASSADAVETLWRIYGKDRVKALPGFRKMTIEQITTALGG